MVVGGIGQEGKVESVFKPSGPSGRRVSPISIGLINNRMVVHHSPVLDVTHLYI